MSTVVIPSPHPINPCSSTVRTAFLSLFLPFSLLNIYLCLISHLYTYTFKGFLGFLFPFSFFFHFSSFLVSLYLCLNKSINMCNSANVSHRIQESHPSISHHFSSLFFKHFSIFSLQIHTWTTPFKGLFYTYKAPIISQFCHFTWVTYYSGIDSVPFH